MDFHQLQKTPAISMEFHGFHGSPWIQLISTDSIDFLRFPRISSDFRGFRGFPCVSTRGFPLIS